MASEQGSHLKGTPGPAISLSYHGGSPPQLSTAIPLLSEFDFQASFYPPQSAFFDDVTAWQKVDQLGHEIGNNSFYGVTLDGDLLNWTLEMVEADLDEGQILLQELFPGKDTRSFAYAGSSTLCARSRDDLAMVSYEPIIRNKFRTALTYEPGYNSWSDIDLLSIRTTLVGSADEVVYFAEKALQEGAWIVFRIESLTGAAEQAHQMLLLWLAENRKRIKPAPVTQIAQRATAITSVKR